MNKLPIDVRGLDVRLPQDLKDWRPAFPEPQEGCNLAYAERASDGTPAFQLRTRARDMLIDLATALRS